MSTSIARTTIFALLLAAQGLAPIDAAAQSPRWNLDREGVVLSGYDVVAYHTEGRAVRGAAVHELTHDGATFRFATAEHRALFERDPEAYAPRFGGFCAFGVAKNHAKVPVDPEVFKIQDGQLLLFFNDLYQGERVNTKPMWEHDEDALLAEAERVWPTLK